MVAFFQSCLASCIELLVMYTCVMGPCCSKIMKCVLLLHTSHRDHLSGFFADSKLLTQCSCFGPMYACSAEESCVGSVLCVLVRLERDLSLRRRLF